MSTLAVIPARGGSKGLPGKNIRPLAGLPLIAHSLECARRCSWITRTVVSTDSQEIAAVARLHGGDVPFLRPSELARDDAPMWPVLRHALEQVEGSAGTKFDFLLLLDPTSPCRLPEDLTGAYERLRNAPDADGIVGVTEPEFNPLWYCVISEGGWMRDLCREAAHFHRRQDLPPVYRINGTLYLWRTGFVRRIAGPSWREAGRFLIHEIPEQRAINIDTLDEFRRADELIRAGDLSVPWLVTAASNRSPA